MKSYNGVVIQMKPLWSTFCTVPGAGSHCVGFNKQGNGVDFFFFGGGGISYWNHVSRDKRVPLVKGFQRKKNAKFNYNNTNCSVCGSTLHTSINVKMKWNVDTLVFLLFFFVILAYEQTRSKQYINTLSRVVSKASCWDYQDFVLGETKYTPHGMTGNLWTSEKPVKSNNHSSAIVNHVM